MAQSRKNTANAHLRKKVQDAIAELSAANQPIKNSTVLEKTGGSLRDVSPLVREAKAEIEARVLAAQAVPDVPEEVWDALQMVWQAAWRSAEETSLAERRGHAQQVDKLDKELDDVLGISEKLEEEASGQMARAEIAEAKLQEMEALVHDLRLEVARLEGRLVERLEARAELETKQNIIESETAAQTSPEQQDLPWPKSNGADVAASAPAS